MFFFFYNSAKKKPKTKKEKILERMRRIHLIRFAIRLHEQNADRMYRARGGMSKPLDKDKEDGNLDAGWRGKVGKLKDRINTARAKLDMMQRDHLRNLDKNK